MKKLTLDLDRLTVDSFETDEGLSLRGTVRGHATIDPRCSGQCDTVDDATCDPDDGCTNTKLGNYTCPASCMPNCTDGCTIGCGY